MFDQLPLYTQEMIFSRVRYVDLFETARVSQGWWTLTIASYERVLHKDDDFLLDLVDFCNEVMPKGEPWEWWMLMEFTKSKKIHLKRDDFRDLINVGNGRGIQYFTNQDIHVQDLRIESNPRSFEDFLKMPPNLNQLFPDLISLDLNVVEFVDPSACVLPSKLKVLKVNSLRMSNSSSLSSILSDPSNLKVLRLTGLESSVYFDGLNFQNLTHLSISPSNVSPNDETEITPILRSIFSQNKRLKSVTLSYADITKEWLQMFPSHVVKLELNRSILSLDLIQILGENVLYERMLLFYICKDWKTVENFDTWDLYWNNSDFRRRNCEIRYVCNPSKNSEEIEVSLNSENIGLSNVILQNDQGIDLTTLKYGGHVFPHVPRTVRNLKIDFVHQPGTLVLEDPTVLLTLDLTRHPSTVINLDDLANMMNLKMLNLGHCDCRHLACILVSCTSLAELNLFNPSKFHVFKEIASDIKSVSLKRLTLLNSNDTLEDILKHLPSLNTLILEDHSERAMLQSEVKSIIHLQYFKAIVNRNKQVAVHLSIIQFPFMVFACSDRHDFYAVSKGMELMNEISVITSANNIVKGERSFILSTCGKREELSLVYTKNVATSFLRNSVIVANTVYDFIVKHVKQR